MIAYLDLPSGVSGDMFLGCLVDAGWPIESLRAAVAKLKLPADEWSIELAEVQKGVLRAARIEVFAPETEQPRNLADIRGIIEASDHPPSVKQKAIAVFTRLAAAEARVHGTSIERIHFHEVGAVDAIIDIVGVIAGLQALGIERLYASPLPLGRGWTSTAHGQIPLPAPATLELLAAANVPTCPALGPGEWVTPTGAALLAELATFEQPPITLRRVGIGAGLKECKWPNIARLWIGEPAGGGPLVQLETNIDDMNPQLYPAVSDKLFAAGAHDVWFTPVHMKKNRPGITLSALGPAASEAALADVMLRETTTLGVRVHVMGHRHEAGRAIETVSTPWGSVRVKIKRVSGDVVGATAEYEDCRALAERANVPVRIVCDAAGAEAQRLAYGRDR